MDLSIAILALLLLLVITYLRLNHVSRKLTALLLEYEVLVETCSENAEIANNNVKAGKTQYTHLLHVMELSAFAMNALSEENSDLHERLANLEKELGIPGK